ncbi:MAG: SAM hydrolase/SAM-dependent halogenase family protein [Candidatus Njordarchaeia archaeon]
MKKDSYPKGRTIALLSDFGSKDFYVGVMKGVILSINPNAVIVDVANDVEKHNIIAGAFALYNSFSYFPKGTIFLAVIDPGVGTEREPILVETKDYFFVAPNNGLIYPVIAKNGIRKIVHLKNKKYFLQNISFTFHGRDIFAPVAAYLSLGLDAEVFGDVLPREKLVKLELIDFSRLDKRIIGKIIYIDIFGNIVTSIPNFELSNLEFGTEMIIKVKDRLINASLKRTYGEAEQNEFIILRGSQGFVEIAMNQKSAAESLGVKVGEKVSLELIK